MWPVDIVEQVHSLEHQLPALLLLQLLHHGPEHRESPVLPIYDSGLAKKWKCHLTLKKGACQPLPKEIFLQLLLYPPPPPPLKPARATSWRKNSNWFKPLLWYCFYTKQYQRRGIGEKNRCSSPDLFLFFAIFTLKMKLFWSSYKIQKRSYNLWPISDF